jgi:hypothetical protein
MLIAPSRGAASIAPDEVVGRPSGVGVGVGVGVGDRDAGAEPTSA